MSVYASGVKNIRLQIMANLEINTLDRRLANKLGYIKNYGNGPFLTLGRVQSSKSGSNNIQVSNDFLSCMRCSRASDAVVFRVALSSPRPLPPKKTRQDINWQRLKFIFLYFSVQVCLIESRLAQ